jgi:hypothetical protein
VIGEGGECHGIDDDDSNDDGNVSNDNSNNDSNDNSNNDSVGGRGGDDNINGELTRVNNDSDGFNNHHDYHYHYHDFRFRGEQEEEEGKALRPHRRRSAKHCQTYGKEAGHGGIRGGHGEEWD